MVVDSSVRYSLGFSTTVFIQSFQWGSLSNTKGYNYEIKSLYGLPIFGYRFVWKIFISDDTLND